MEDGERFVQIAGASDGVYALDKDGLVWYYEWNNQEWVYLKNKRKL